MNTINTTLNLSKKITKYLLPLFLLNFVANEDTTAQDFWQQTNGPYVRDVQAFAINSKGHFVAGTLFDEIFRST